MRTGATALACVLALVLAGCERGADTTASPNPNAPRSPGTGNAVESVAPQAPDTPPGGPSGVAGSTAHPGASGGDAVPGSTGHGTQSAAGQAQQPGVGLGGGLGAGAAMGAASGTAVAPGGKNRTTAGSVGN